MEIADKKIKMIFKDLDGCPSIVMPFNIYENLRDEFFHKNVSDYIKFDDFVYYMRSIPTSEGVINCCAFITWWSNHPTYRYYWPKRELLIHIETGYYSDIVYIIGLTKMETDSSRDFDMELAKRQMKDLINGTYGIQTSNFILPKKIIHNNPATIVFWSDNTKTVAKCRKGDIYDPEVGFYVACAKKLFGNDYRAGGIIKTALEKSLKKVKKNG